MIALIVVLIVIAILAIAVIVLYNNLVSTMPGHRSMCSCNAAWT